MFIPLIVAVVVPPTLLGINAWHKKVVQKQNKKIGGSTFKVRYSSLVFGSLMFLAVFAGLSAALFPVLYLCDIPDGPPLSVAVGTACGFGAVSVISSLYLFVLKRWQIRVSDEKIEFTPFFGKSREYCWEDICGVKVRGQPYGVVITYQVFVKQSDKKAFSFTSFMVGGEKLAEKLRKLGLI